MHYAGAMMRRALIAIAVCAMYGAAAADELGRTAPSDRSASGHDCSCLNRGERVLLGDMTCIKVGEREFTAQCMMTLNNPSWHYVEEGCRPPEVVSLLLN